VHRRPARKRQNLRVTGRVPWSGTNTQIAHRLGGTEGTVRKHLENIYSRPHVSSRTGSQECSDSSKTMAPGLRQCRAG
jgi:predicted ArsR family transcriptional regulator